MTVTGTSEANRNLYVFWVSGTAACAATPTNQGVRIVPGTSR